MALINATKKNKPVQTTKNKTPVQTPAQIAQGMKVAAMLAATGAGGQGAEGEWGILNDTEAKSAGLVTDRSALLATVPKGSDGNAPQTLGDVVLRGASSRTTPASMTATAPTTTRGNAPSVAGKTANSAGSFYGSAGTNTMGTSFGTQSTGSRVDRTAGISQDPMSEYMNLFSPQSAIDRQEQIRKDLARERQQQIDAIEMSARQAVSAEQAAGAQDLARQRSMNLRSGLGGSDFGAANKAEIRTRTNQNVQGIEAQRDMAIGSAIDKIEQLAQSRFQIEQNALQQGFGNLMQVQEYTQAQEQQMRAQTLDSLKTLGQSGMDIQTIKQRDPDLYEKLTVASGMSDVEVEAVLNNAKPAPERTDYQYKVMGNKLIAYGVDPMTGQLKTMEQEVDMPDNYSVTTMPDGTVLGIPAEWDGDTSKIVTVGNYRRPFASEMGGSTAGVVSGEQTTGDPVVDSWVGLINSGQATITNVPTNLRNAVAGAMAGATSNNVNPQQTRDQIALLKTTVADAKNIYKASGPSGISRYLGDTFVGDTKFRQLEALTNTLRTNALTLMTDPSIKKFFGPQMSNADVQLMTAAGTTLNPEKQSPEQMKKELERLEELFARMERALPSNTQSSRIPTSLRTGVQSFGVMPTSNTRTMADQAGYDYDAMRADGLSDAQIQQALTGQ